MKAKTEPDCRPCFRDVEDGMYFEESEKEKKSWKPRRSGWGEDFVYICFYHHTPPVGNYVGSTIPADQARYASSFQYHHMCMGQPDCVRRVRELRVI